ncbi:hypothetical protein [Dyadobacter luteus]|uniref:hypothetical protein n=1 Tax=Dyadobacter luteus TaxID=2259619 RepID=UPI0011C07ABF|nr:hypothetical protein [Dyadobacter luteus]
MWLREFDWTISNSRTDDLQYTQKYFRALFIWSIVTALAQMFKTMEQMFIPYVFGYIQADYLVPHGRCSNLTRQTYIHISY